MDHSARPAGTSDPAAGSPGDRREAAADRIDAEALREAIIVALRKVRDPEIHVNIYDLGLIYRIDIASDGDVAIDMTLTRASCPAAGILPLQVKNAVGGVDGVGLIDVKMVWDPPWSQGDSEKGTAGVTGGTV